MFKELKLLISRRDRLIIQTHDNPDHDAIAAAYALQQLLVKFSLQASMCYGGTIRSSTLNKVIKKLKIDISHLDDTPIDEKTQVIYVDGCREGSNVTPSVGQSIAMIDHHSLSLPSQSQYKFADVRVEYGACSSILSEYYQEVGLLPMPNVATVLMMGIMMDTAYLTRGVNSADLAAIQYLYPQADWYSGSKLLRNSLVISDIALFREAFENKLINDNFCFILLRSDSAPDSVSLLADFFLNIHEIDFVVVAYLSDKHYRLSVRSDTEELPAHELLQMAINGIGSGGGHEYMAGGLIDKASHHAVEQLNDRFLKLIQEKQSHV